MLFSIKDIEQRSKLNENFIRQILEREEVKVHCRRIEDIIYLTELGYERFFLLEEKLQKVNSMQMELALKDDKIKELENDLIKKSEEARMNKMEFQGLILGKAEGVDIQVKYLTKENLDYKEKARKLLHKVRELEEENEKLRNKKSLWYWLRKKLE